MEYEYEVGKKIEMLKDYDRRMELCEKPFLKNFFLEVTSRCNAKCEHCGSSCGEKIPKDEIELKYLKKALKEVADAYDATKILLNVTGGEPLLRSDLFELMQYAVDLGYRWGMTTNGMLINKDIAKKIEKTKMDTVSISIDGLKETHEKFRKVPGCFDKIIAGIKLLQKNKYLQTLQVTTVANKRNIDQLEDLYKLMLELGIKDWRVINCDPIGRAKINNDILLDAEDYKYLFKFIKKKNDEGKIKVTYGCSHYLGVDLEHTIRPYYFACLTGLSVASILSNGDIFVCPNVERRPELIQGNIKKDSFVDVWENKFEQFRKKRVNQNKKCKECSEFKFCAGDSFHTWNFDENKPNICLKEILKEVKE